MGLRWAKAPSSCQGWPARCCDERGLARAALPTRRHLGWRRDELLGLLRARRGSLALPVRRRRHRDHARDDLAPRPELALLPAGRRAATALLLSCARPVRAARW